MKSNDIKFKLLGYFKKKNRPSVNIIQDSRIDEGFQQKSNTSSCPSLNSSSTLLSEHKIGNIENGILKDFLYCLPVELACIILSLCDQQTLFICHQVSKYWNGLCRDNLVWKQLYLINLGDIYHSTLNLDYKSLYQRKLQLLQRWKNGTPMQLQTIIGHSDSIYCVQFDTTKIVTGSRDRTIKFWNPVTNKCIRTLSGHGASVLCLQYDQSILVSGSSDHTLVVWSLKTFTIQYCLRGHTSGVLDVCFNDKLIISCSKDATIRIWDRTKGHFIKVLVGHRGPVNAIQLIDRRLVSASGDTFIKLWDIDTGACLRDFLGHAYGLACIRFDGKKIVSGSNDNKIKVWNAGRVHTNYTLYIFFFSFF